MARPPKSSPHSDIDGVHQDEEPNTATAEEAGQTAADLDRARELAKGRPPHTDEESLDDRS